MLSLVQAGLSHDQAREYLNHLVDSQSVTIATNQVMALMTLVFATGAGLIWFAPKPRRAIDMTQAGH